MNSDLLCVTTMLVLSSCCSSRANARHDVTDPSRKPAAATLPRTVFAFDQDRVGELPAHWKAESTHPAIPSATWKVVADDTAPSKSNVLSLVSTNLDTADTFNICWTDRVRFQDGRIEIAFKANSGQEDQGGGAIWRVQDLDNYYVCRANPLESNIRLYYVEKGSRTQLATAQAKIPSGRWHTIAIEHHGQRIECALNGERLLVATDGHIPLAGGIGVWTKSDAATSFDDLEVRP